MGVVLVVLVVLVGAVCSGAAMGAPPDTRAVPTVGSVRHRHDKSPAE